MNLIYNRNLDKVSFWGKWFCCIVILICIQSITMGIAPFLHKDEFMIVDLGRIILNPTTEWSITWLSSKEKPVLLWSYLGPIFQEFSFHIMGEYGPRISALAGAIVASTTMVYYLLLRGVSKNGAFLLGLIFLLDPLFVQGFTMGRVDGWTMALCLSACCILSDPKGPGIYKEIGIRAFGAGALAAIAFLTWPSAFFLFPLILYQLLLFCNKQKHFKAPLLLFSIGGLMISLLVLLPIASRIFEQFDEVEQGLITNLKHKSTSTETPLYLYVFNSFLELLRILKFTPFLTLIAFLGLMLRKEISLALTTIAVVSFMVCTLVYVHRVQYLLPYLILSASLIHSHRSVVSQSRLYIFLKNPFMVVIALLWCSTLSLGIRSILAIEDRAEKERNLVFKAAQVLVGKGNHTVLSTNEFYYSGRALGWKMFSPYLAVGEPFSSAELKRILPHVDYVIMHTYGITQEFKDQFKKEEFERIGVYKMYSTPRIAESRTQTNIGRLRNFYSIHQKPYGPYSLYVRERNLKARN